MADMVAPEVRSRMMASIKGKNTKSEVALRRALHARGLRYRLHHRRLPGSPDIVLSKWNTVVFIHGCFWHRHPGCPMATVPKTRTEFWTEKFEKNIVRDRKAEAALGEAGWRIAVVWECRIKRIPSDELVDTLVAFVRSGEGCRLELG